MSTHAHCWRLQALALLLSGCNEFFIDDADNEITQPLVVEEVFTQEPLPKVDILWVIDNTPSMADEHQLLAESIEPFAEALTDMGLAWQVGAITTDVSNEQAGVLQGSPWILTPDIEDPISALQDLTHVGTDGSSPEAGFGATVLALSEPLRSEDNRGFRREDASLHIVVVSDDDDDSSTVLGEDAATAFLSFLEEEAAQTGRATVVSAVVGEVPSGCSGKAGTALPGTQYTEVANATGGTVGSICEGDLSAVSEAIGEASAEWPTAFGLQAEPSPEDVRVSVDGIRLDEGWSLVSEPPQLVFDAPPEPGAEIRIRYEIAEP